MSHNGIRALAGLATVAVLAAIVLVAAGLFTGYFETSVPVTVLSPRAGLVMDPDAKVKMRGVQVGKVDSIETRSDDTCRPSKAPRSPTAFPAGSSCAVLHLAMDPSQLHFIPANVLVDIASTTVFGAKFVELLPPAAPSGQLRAGDTLGDKDTPVTVEINTVFEQLRSLLTKIDPAKLNETLGAIASAFNGRGHQIGQALSDLDAFLAKTDPSLASLSHDLEVLPAVANAYADAAPDLTKTIENTTRISQTIVDEQQNLEAFLISAIGLADTGNEVVGGNRQALTDVLHLLVPTTNLTNQYHQALWCSLAGAANTVKAPPLDSPGIKVLASFEFGAERYRYPVNLPKVAATGGPQCEELPLEPPDVAPAYVVADVGANPWQYGNPQLLINSDALKQLLYGPLDGPPRNSLQIGQPG